MGFWDVGEVEGEHGFGLALLSCLLPATPLLARVEGVALVVFVGVALGLPGVVAGPVGVSVLPGLSAWLVLPLAGAELDAEPPGAAFGLAVLLAPGAAFAVEERVGGHAVDVPLTRPAVLAPGPAPPPAVLARVPPPAVPWLPPLLLEENPTTELSCWARVSRNGENARTMPMANTAQATAMAGRSRPYFHFPDCGPPWPGSLAPPRTAFQRRTRPARKPPSAPAFAYLLAWVGPAWTRARIRSSPSGRGST
jgi:hypothetical protein